MLKEAEVTAIDQSGEEKAKGKVYPITIFIQEESIFHEQECPQQVTGLPSPCAIQELSSCKLMSLIKMSGKEETCS